MRKQKRRDEETGWQEASAVLRRALEGAMADKRSEAQAAATRSSPKPESETDPDLFRFDLAYRLKARICLEPRRCANRRCRRLGRCRELLKIGRLREAHCARMAREGGIAGNRDACGATKTQRNH